MINVNEVYKAVSFLANKDQRGYFTPEDFNMILPKVSGELFSQRLGLPESYQPGRPVPNIAYAVTQKIEDDLLPFLKRSMVYPDAKGMADYPADFVHPVSLSKTIRKENGEYIEVDVDIVPKDRLRYRLNSPIETPTYEYPVCSFYGNYIQFYPKRILNAHIEYLKYPDTPVWAYTTVSGRAVYDSVNSVHLEWGADLENQIITRICSLLGINLRDGELIQYAESKKANGV